MLSRLSPSPYVLLQVPPWGASCLDLGGRGLPASRFPGTYSPRWVTSWCYLCYLPHQCHHLQLYQLTSKDYTKRSSKESTSNNNWVCDIDLGNVYVGNGCVYT
ncbi:hypothetical protein F4808DRAFT_335127 [Astrocystis sublimbata]|nr:hypothetical protein F4808DRAFT_335127 [Astrocystis sublimbata]